MMMEVPMCASVGPHGGHCIDTPRAHLVEGEHYAFDLSGRKIAWSDTPETPNGCIECVGLYDNGGETFDRYTALFVHSETGESWYLAMSEHPFHPQGFGQHGEGDVSGVVERDTRIDIADAPGDVQRAIAQELAP